jgi:hypothetical protein
MRLSLGLGPLGAALLLAAALPLADGSGWLAGAQTAAAQSASSSGRKAGPKRPAAKAPAEKPKGQDAAADTDRVLDTAAKSLAEGNADAATTALDSILSGGGLSNKHMARALYLRGVAHHKKARLAQAIADLTSAVWLKDGLSDQDRTAALKERSEISREVGVADTGAPPGAAAPSASPAPAAQTGLITRPPPVGAPGLTEGGFPRVVATAPERAPPPPRQDPVAQPSQAPAPQTGLVTRPPPIGGPGLTEGGFPRVVANAPPSTPAAPRAGSGGDGVVLNSGKATSSWESGTSVGTRDRSPPVEDRPKTHAAAPAPGGAPASGGGVGEFFSGLFGGGSPSSPPARATKTADAPSWSTSVREPTNGRSARKPAEKSTALATSAVPAQSKGAQGGYQLQVAAVRSRAEAESVAARLKKEHGRVIGSHRLEVDETVYGNMGTFYRVRLGPFAAADESKALCNQLRTKGYDCLVVTE